MKIHISFLITLFCYLEKKYCCRCECYVPLVTELRDDLFDGFLSFIEEMCNKSFNQYESSAAGQASGCPVVVTTSAPSVEVCINQACSHGGNTVNYNPGDCHVLLCKSPDELELTGRLGGYDIHVLIGLGTSGIERQTSFNRTACNEFGW